MTAQQAAMASVTIVHDHASADLAQIADTVLSKSSPAHLDLNAGENSSVTRPGQYWLIFDLQAVDQAIIWQDRIREQGGEVIAIGQEPGHIWFGPVFGPEASGCLRCLKSWIANNRRDPQHWSASRSSPVKPRETAQIALSGGARAIITAQFQLLDSGRSTAHGVSGAKVVRRLNPADLTCVTHSFVPLPACLSCSRRPEDTAEGAIVKFKPRLKATPEASRAENPLLTISRLREAFVDRQTGMIKHVFNDLTSNLMPMAAAEIPIMGDETVEQGFGRTETSEGSHLVAMLESLERFAGHEPRGKRPSVRGSYSEISKLYGSQCLHPSTYEMHTDEQMASKSFGLKRYSDDLPIDWCWGFSTRRQEPVLVPSQLVYYWLPDHKDKPVNRFIYDSSNGCAMGGSVEEAALHGLYEVVERDAYLTSWYAHLSPRRIDLSSLTDPNSLALLARARAEGYEVHLFDMRLDVSVPAVWGMIVDPSANAPVKSYCASAASGDWDQAVFSALVEITTSIGVYKETMPALKDRAYELLKDPWKVVEMHDHVLLYSLEETLPRLDFLFEGGTVSIDQCRSECPSMREQNLTRELEIQIDKVLKVAKDVILIVQDFDTMTKMGLSCVKVLVPGLTPVTFGHQYRRFDLARLNNAARSQGRPELSERSDVNPDPHNFP